MRVELHDRLTSPLRVEATRVVVYDNLDNPIIVAVSHGSDARGREHVSACHAGEREFASKLRELGIAQTVVIDKH